MVRKPTAQAASDGKKIESAWKSKFRTAKDNNAVRENPAVRRATANIPITLSDTRNIALLSNVDGSIK